MAETNRIEDLANATAYDVDGEKLGGVKDVYVNDTTGQPDFVSVNHGLFGGGDSIVPLRGHLTTEDQDAFYRHYGLEGTQDVTTYETDNRTAQAGAAGTGAAAGAGYAAGEREVDADRRDVANDDEIVRSEEQLNVSKDRVETGQVRLRKYVVNETETVEVPVEREEVRVVREPITDADRANYDGNIGEQEASVTKESVPVEKVSLEKDTVQDTERVTEDVRKERFETDGVVEGDVRDADRDNLR